MTTTATHVHDWAWGECQTCGALHPEDCFDCAPQALRDDEPVAADDHTYRAPDADKVAWQRYLDDEEDHANGDDGSGY